MSWINAHNLFTFPCHIISSQVIHNANSILGLYILDSESFNPSTMLWGYLIVFVYVLTGSLPRDMWNLTKLQELYLGWNNITGILVLSLIISSWLEVVVVAKIVHIALWYSFSNNNDYYYISSMLVCVYYVNPHYPR